MEVVLASASPRRRELLSLLGISYRVRPTSDVDEDSFAGPPRVLVTALARAKAQAVAEAERREESGGVLVLGADTVIFHEGDVLGKPRDAADAREMLERLSGDVHEVFTGLAVARPCGRVDADVSVSRVVFRKLSARGIAEYVRAGEPLGKAGGYAIQGSGSGLLAALDGCYYNVVGLPLRLAARMLAAAGVPCAQYRCDCARHPLQRGEPDCALVRSSRRPAEGEA